jgi:hypothetical protein
VDIDATIVTAYSEKEQAAPTWKKTYGHHPLTVFADHGPEGARLPRSAAGLVTSRGSGPPATRETPTRWTGR